MGLLLFWIFQGILSAALAAKPGTHYHRYLLSEYKPQHNPKTQMDYKRHSPQSKLEENNNNTTDTQTDDKGQNPQRRTLFQRDGSKKIGKIGEPLVQLNRSGKKVLLHHLTVRIYQDDKYSCVGTQISESLVVTAATCFDETSTELVNMKTYSDKVITGRRRNQNETIVPSEGSLLAVIVLTKPTNDILLKGDSVKLCTSKLLDAALVKVPIWIRSRHSIYSFVTKTLPVQECRHRLKDDQGKIATDSVICVKNDRYTSTCQNAIGNPLISNHKICGVNMAGHNCPTFTGIELFSAVYDKRGMA